MSSWYREYPPPSRWEHLVACTWEQQADQPHAQRVIPDGCVDLIWLAERELIFAGPDTAPREVQLPGAMRSTGVRLKPGVAGAVLGLPASHLRDQHVSAQDVWGARASEFPEALSNASPTERLRLLAGAVTERRPQPDLVVLAAAQRLARPEARVATVAAELGFSQRTLERRVRTAVGYGPKMLARVLRLRRLVSLPEESLAARAWMAGYASQAHMNEEVRRLTGTTAVGFLKDAALTAA